MNTTSYLYKFRPLLLVLSLFLVCSSFQAANLSYTKDAVSPILVNILPHNCNATLPYIFSTIGCYLPDLPEGVTENGYKFYVKNLNTGQVEEVFRSIRNFKLTMTSIYEYNTSYDVRAAVKIDDDWQPYGASCIISTPTIPITQIIHTFCGTSLPYVFSSIGANTVNSALAYRFRIVNTLNPTEIETYESLENRFNLTMLTLYPIRYNTSYTVSVQVKVLIDGAEVWSNYGATCEVITPSPAVTQVTISQCEYIATSMTDIIHADLYPSATLYKYKLQNSFLGYEQIRVRTTNEFTLAMFSGLQPNTAYTISISIKNGGVYGPYGKSCEVTTPSSLSGRTSESVVSVYPNPFTENCFIKIDSAVSKTFDVIVYNSLGIAMEHFKTDSNVVWTLTKNGFLYPSGVYRVVLKNENEVQNFTIVKK